MSALYKKAESLVRYMPFINRLLKPGITLFRRIQRTKRLASEQKAAKKTTREIERFRRYCSNMTNLVAEPVFIKVGANDGITDDPCSDILLANMQWKGLLIEPVPYCFDRLKNTYSNSQRFSLEQVAVGSSPGKASFYYSDCKARDVQPNLAHWFDQLGSFDRNHIVKHGIPEHFIVERTVQVCTLSLLVERNGIRDIHLLHIDTEGYDYEVLKSLDFKTHSPILVFVEHVHVPEYHKKGMLKLLKRQGYSVHDCGRDYFAINKMAFNRLKRKKPLFNQYSKICLFIV